MLEHGVEQSLYFAQAAKICKSRGAFFNKKFASGAGLDFLQSCYKILARNLQGSEFGGYRAVSFEWNGSEETAQRDHADFLAQRLEISADEAVGMLGDFLKIYIIGERHGARVNLENLQTCLIIWHSNFDFAIEASRPSQRRVQDFGNVGRTDHDDLATGCKAIHQSEQWRHN